MSQFHRDRMQRILHGNAGQILDEAAEQVRVRAEAAKKRYRASRRSNPTWGFAISPDRPLEFQEGSLKRSEVPRRSFL